VMGGHRIHGLLLSTFEVGFKMLCMGRLSRMAKTFVCIFLCAHSLIRIRQEENIADKIAIV
jgi:hypothetical protein